MEIKIEEKKNEIASELNECDHLTILIKPNLTKCV